MFDTMRDDVAVPSAGIVDDPVNAEPVPLSEVPTSGWLGVELGIASENPGSLSDRDLVDAIVGFERAASWQCREVKSSTSQDRPTTRRRNPRLSISRRIVSGPCRMEARRPRREANG
jgi:hypothetical protein